MRGGPNHLSWCLGVWEFHSYSSQVVRAPYLRAILALPGELTKMDIGWETFQPAKFMKPAYIGSSFLNTEGR